MYCAFIYKTVLYKGEGALQRIDSIILFRVLLALIVVIEGYFFCLFERYGHELCASLIKRRFFLHEHPGGRRQRGRGGGHHVTLKPIKGRVIHHFCVFF